MIHLQPTICNLCNGEVIYTSNSKIYGREYGSGKMYFCTKCGAYVGTHIPRPKEAFGILANEEMREMKKKCHSLFDEKWIHEKTIQQKKKARKKAYKWLADTLGIAVEECHFGYFDIALLKQAYETLENQICS